MAKLTRENFKITELDVKDIRFPTSLGMHGSDAMHTNPDYSCAYVTLRTAQDIEGHGITFTLGRGTEIVVQAIQSLSHLVVGEIAIDIYKDFAGFWRILTSESQLRWLGPEKGVMHLAVAGIINALWDLWAMILHKPIWRLLADMDPEHLVSTIDFRYISDVLTKDDAIELLTQGNNGKEERIEKLLESGFPAYTTQVGWLGYTEEEVTEGCKRFLEAGFTAFKIKIGQNLDDDIARLKLVRSVIGNDKKLMVDANQMWDVPQAIDWMKKLAEFKITWIEEPTSPDDVLGHAAIAKALKPFGISVATGEMCANRVMFKQFMQAKAFDYCQIDSCRIGGINEILAVYLMAKKMNVKVCPHAGGVGLCEMVQHLQMWDYVALSGQQEDCYIEYVDHMHEYFENPSVIEKACYKAPICPGYSTKFKKETIEKFEYPNGSEWQNLFEKGLFPKLHELIQENTRM